MSYTSAQSGDNYRNWWPHARMTEFISDSIDELERFTRDTGNVFNMTRRGYVLATRREDISQLINALQPGIDVDIHDARSLRREFPYLATDIRHALHVRRGGDISGQQLAAWMLDTVRTHGGQLLRGRVRAIEQRHDFILELDDKRKVHAEMVVNAGGPFADDIASMLGISLPVRNVFQQKVAFEDRRNAIPRDMPFSIDLDEKALAWTGEEQALLEDDADRAWLTRPIRGGTHCRAEGGTDGQWVKLGWAYNDASSDACEDLANEPASDPQFPEIVMRGAAAFIPSLDAYITVPPTRYSHYGGYYTMTEENWPLIGPMGHEGAFMVSALSGFGSMAACAAGKLCAAWVNGNNLPEYASALSMQRLADVRLMKELRGSASKGLL